MFIDRRTVQKWPQNLAKFEIISDCDPAWQAVFWANLWQSAFLSLCRFVGHLNMVIFWIFINFWFRATKLYNPRDWSGARYPVFLLWVSGFWSHSACLKATFSINAAAHPHVNGGAVQPTLLFLFLFFLVADTGLSTLLCRLVHWSHF